MGSIVGVVYRLMPTSVDVDMKGMADAVRTAIPAEVKLRGMQVQDIAYGLKALLLSVQMADEGGILDRVEAILKSVPHVENVEVIDTSLL
jgi:translation elongation factor aEF-1 beta